MTLVAGFEHVHVTEREGAHQGPCGWDNASWEDCMWVACIEWVRMTGDPQVPATHDEAEHLRCASGEPPTEGSSIDDLIRGVSARYGRKVPKVYASFDALWAALVPGTAAVVQGVMGALDDHWRRWSLSFKGNHGAFVVRVDDTDRVWWCDGLAPLGVGYSGEYMPKATLKQFVSASSGSRHIVAPVVAGEDMYAIQTQTPLAGGNRHFSIPKGATINGYSCAQPGKVVKSSTFPDGSGASASHRVGVTWQGTTTPPIPKGYPFLLVADGIFKGLLIVESSVVLDPDPPAVGQADLDAAHSKGVVEGRQMEWDIWHNELGIPDRP